MPDCINCGDFILREPRESDIQDRMELGRSPEFVRMCGGSTVNFAPEFDVKDLRNWYETICEHPCLWIVEINGKCAGTARLTANETEEKARYSVGIFDKKLYGKGYGTKVTRAVLDYAFDVLKLSAVDLAVLEYNERAIRCYEKCGFKKIGVAEEKALIDDKYYFDIIMEATKKQTGEL